MGRKTYNAIIGAVLLEGDKVARAGWDSRLGYPSVDPPHWTRLCLGDYPRTATYIRLLVLSYVTVPGDAPKPACEVTHVA